MFILAASVHVSTGDRAVRDEFSCCIADHVYVRTPKKMLLDSSRVTALDTESFDIPPMTHELRDSRKVIALSQAVLADFRSQILVRTRIRPESARF